MSHLTFGHNCSYQSHRCIHVHGWCFFDNLKTFSVEFIKHDEVFLCEITREFDTLDRCNILDVVLCDILFKFLKKLLRIQFFSATKNSHCKQCVTTASTSETYIPHERIACFQTIHHYHLKLPNKNEENLHTN